MIKPGTEVFIWDPVGRPLLAGALLNRVLAFPGFDQAEARILAAKVIAGQPGMLPIVVTSYGVLVGHFVCEVIGKKLKVYQALVDEGFPRAIDLALEKADNWCRARGVTGYIMESALEPPFHDPATWVGKYRRYGFKPTAYTLEREID